MKKYIKPIAKLVSIENEELLAGSPGGVATGGTPGGEFNGEDISYGNQGTWDDFVLEDEEESSRW